MYRGDQLYFYHRSHQATPEFPIRIRMRTNTLKPSSGILPRNDEEEEEEEEVGEGYVFLKKTGILRRKSAPEMKLTTSVSVPNGLKKISIPMTVELSPHISPPEPSRKAREKSPVKNSSTTPRYLLSS